MLTFADTIRAGLVPFIAGVGALLGVLLMILIVQRIVREAIVARHARRKEYCRPFVDAWISPDGHAAALERLVARCGGRNRRAAAGVLLPPLRSITGDVVLRAHAALTRLGLRDEWRRDLGDRRWWRRSEAAQALGLIGDSDSAAALVHLLDDEHDEVRAAALDALSRLAHPETLPRLASLVADKAYPRARVVAALEAFGPAAAAELVRQADSAGIDRHAAAEALGHLRSAIGLDALTSWCGDENARVRAAALQAIGDIGLDGRAYYFALRALEDPETDVRVTAARALGRSGRAEAAPYLAQHLVDQWQVAAHCAAALKQLGEDGIACLQAAAATDGQRADLARQMLWELGG